MRAQVDGKEVHTTGAVGIKFLAFVYYFADLGLWLVERLWSITVCPGERQGGPYGWRRRAAAAMVLGLEGSEVRPRLLPTSSSQQHTQFQEVNH